MDKRIRWDDFRRLVLSCLDEMRECCTATGYDHSRTPTVREVVELLSAVREFGLGQSSSRLDGEELGRWVLAHCPEVTE